MCNFVLTELPETSFTRSISNPEAVMRRRRQQKLERKLQLFRSKDGGPDTGGTLKIYGESLCKDVPYKTLLLSVRETAAYVVREMLDKYGLNKEDPANYCLVQVSRCSLTRRMTGGVPVVCLVIQSLFGYFAPVHVSTDGCFPTLFNVMHDSSISENPFFNVQHLSPLSMLMETFTGLELFVDWFLLIELYKSQTDCAHL